MAGKLTLVATPLGNLSDLSPRAVEALGLADGWIVEDTRVSGKLQAVLGLKKSMVVLNDHTPPRKLEEFLSRLQGGESFALLTDAGTPCISDPGSSLVDLVREAEIEVDSIPGPSAPTLALSLSGFFAQRYAFLGYLPRKQSAIKRELEPFENSFYTLVLFESSHRIEPLMRAAQEVLGTRRYAICRELTKVHQQVYRGTLDIVPDESEVPRKGEFTIVLEGKRRSQDNRDEEW